VATSVKEMSPATITFINEIYRGDTLLAIGEIKIAAVKESGLPGRIPAEIAAALSADS
jgi:acyl-CoA thioesterase FadM